MSTIQWRPEQPGVTPLRAHIQPAKPDLSQPTPKDQVSLQDLVLPEPPPQLTDTPQLTDAPVQAGPPAPTPAVPSKTHIIKVPTTLLMEDPAPASEAAPAPQLAPWAQVSRQTFFNPLSSIPATSLGPLGDFLELAPGTDLQERKPAILKWAQDRQAFVGAYTAAMKDKTADGSPNDSVQALKQLEQQWLQPGSSATPEMRTMLMEGFRGKGSFEDVARVYETSLKQDKDFKKYEIPREYYIVALNKTKQTVRSIDESQNFLKERLTDLHLSANTGNRAERYQAYRDSGLNGEIFAGLGRAFKDIHTAAQKEIGKRIDQSGIGQLMQDLSAAPSQDWSVFGGTSLGQQASMAAGQSVQDSLVKVLKKPDSLPELTTLLESQSGLKADQWKTPPDQLQQKLLDSDPQQRLPLLASMLGRPIEQWAVQSQKMTEVTNQAIRPFAEKFLAGRMSAGEAVEELSAVTGGKLKGAIPQGVLIQKLEDLKKDLSTNGGLDPALASVLSKTTGTPIGSDLLDASRKAMEVSRDHYVNGFAIDFEYYPGVNAVYNNLFLGNNQEAERLAPMVLASCEREGGRTTKDYWNLATQVELGLIMNDPGALLKSLPRALENAKAGWELSTTADSIEKLSQMRKMDHADTQLLDFVGEKLRERIAAGFPPQDPEWNQKKFVDTICQDLQAMPGVSAAKTEQLDPERVQITDKLREKGTNFCEAFNSKFVGGNVPFGGQVGDVPINRPDLRATRQVIAKLGLDKVTDFETFTQRVDPYVEGRFGLVDPESGKRVLEDLHSPEHEVMDRFSKERHNLTEARTSGASKTNLAMELLMGTGDCRHTAISKQALFDVWKRDHQSNHLKQALEATEKGDSAGYQQEMAKVKEWDRLQLVTFTMTFSTPIDLHKDAEGKPQKYALNIDDQGRPVKTPDGTSLEVEDHTFNALLRFDENGLVLPFEQGGLVTQDVFYKGFYPLAGRPVDPRQVLDPKGFDLGTVGVATADGEHLPFRGQLTRFSGSSPMPIAGECGQTTFGGLATAFNSADILTEARSKTRNLVELVSGTEGNHS